MPYAAKVTGMCSKKKTGEKGGRQEMVAQVDATLSSEYRQGGAPFNDAHQLS
jgi:hypothetical protein